MKRSKSLGSGALWSVAFVCFLQHRHLANVPARQEGQRLGRIVSRRRVVSRSADVISSGTVVVEEQSWLRELQRKSGKLRISAQENA